jgi:hypothetical protein
MRAESRRVPVGVVSVATAYVVPAARPCTVALEPLVEVMFATAVLRTAHASVMPATGLVTLAVTTPCAPTCTDRSDGTTESVVVDAGALTWISAESRTVVVPSV